MKIVADMQIRLVEEIYIDLNVTQIEEKQCPRSSDGRGGRPSPSSRAGWCRVCFEICSRPQWDIQNIDTPWMPSGMCKAESANFLRHPFSGLSMPLLWTVQVQSANGKWLKSDQERRRNTRRVLVFCTEGRSSWWALNACERCASNVQWKKSPVDVTANVKVTAWDHMLGCICVRLYNSDCMSSHVGVHVRANARKWAHEFTHSSARACKCTKVSALRMCVTDCNCESNALVQNASQKERNLQRMKYPPAANKQRIAPNECTEVC